MNRKHINKYNNPTVVHWELDSRGNKTSVVVNNEQKVVVDGKAVLEGLPDINHRVYIDNMYEVGIDEEISNPNQFKVDYRHTGTIFFHQDMEGKTILVKRYYSKGIVYLPAGRIWTKVDDFGEVTETLETVADEVDYVYENIHHLDESIQSGHDIHDNILQSIKEAMITQENLNDINEKSIQTKEELVETDRKAQETNARLSQTNTNAEDIHTELTKSINDGLILDNNMIETIALGNEIKLEISNEKDKGQATIEKLEITTNNSEDILNKMKVHIDEGKQTKQGIKEAAKSGIRVETGLREAIDDADIDGLGKRITELEKKPAMTYHMGDTAPTNPNEVLFWIDTSN